MKKLITILSFLLLATEGFPQLTSFIWSGDTLFCVNPSTGVSVQVSNKPVPWSSVTSKPSVVPTSTTVNAHSLGADVTIMASDVGLGNVNNTSDANKPISSAAQTALNLKAPLASPTFTGTVAGITATMVGLGSVDNTSDVNKPVSTAGQTALNLKANLASPTFTGTVAGITSTMVGLGSVDNTSDVNKPVSTAQQTALNLKANLASPTFTGTVAGITATMVGLGNVTNESKATMFTNATFTGTFTAPNTTITNAMLAGSIDLTSKMTGVLPFANGGIGAGAATSATTGTMTVSMTTAMVTITPTGACTFNASGGVTGQTVTFVVTTSGTSSFVLTFGTNFKSAGTLSTGTTTGKVFTVSFLCTNATPTWTETARTTAQ